MNRRLLALAVAVLGSSSLHAQQRLVLYEEFSGENCAPCATYNPGLWSLLSANPTNALLLKYQCPIPSAGPIYNAYPTVTDARALYYNVPFAPYGRLDGTGLGTGTAVSSGSGHIANLLQADIGADAAVAAPFTIGATHQWNAAGDSLTATVTVTSPRAYAPGGALGANLKLRVALIEHLQYATAPGNNGETDFHNVVREMYPNAGGTPLPSSWAAGQSQRFTLKGRVPSYVNKAPSGETRIVVWVQNDTDQSIPQAAVSAYLPVAVDVASSGLTLPSTFVCDSASTRLHPVVSLTNPASTTISSATIYYRLDAGTWQTYNWTGSLTAQGTTLVNLPAITATPGVHLVADSVAMPNGAPDPNGGNNTSEVRVIVYNTAGAALPLATGFENSGAVPIGWTLYDVNNNEQNWALFRSPTSNVGHNNSAYSLRHNNSNFFGGEVNYAIIPAANLPSGGKFLDFFLAYAQLFTISDQLEVVYSTDCGASWTSVWNRSGTALATAPPASFSLDGFVPTQADWALQTVDLTAVPANAMLAFRATSGFGNNLYVDDVVLRAAPLATLADAVPQNSVALVPNPANTESVLSFYLLKPTTVQVEVVDALGRVVVTPTGGHLSVGLQHLPINTAALTSGLYTVVIRTAEGRLTRHLSVVH